MLSSHPRTRRAFTSEDLSRLKALYDDPSIPLQRVANDYGLPVSTLLRWVAEMDWPRRSARGRAPCPTSPPAPPLASAPMSSEPPAAPAPKRPAPQKLSALLSVSQLARRELSSLAAYPARTLEERERVARLVATLTRSLERIDAGVTRERERREDRRWARERAAMMRDEA
jgi:transposase-like protein